MKKRMKPWTMSALILALLCFLSGCRSQSLSYEGNLGYDLSSIDYQTISYCIYHSNTEGHIWEPLATFSCSPEKGHYTDILLDSRENHITISLNEQYTKMEGSTAYFYSNRLDTYEFQIDGFQGTLSGFQNFEIKDTEDEQLYRLYPVNNDSVVTFSNSKPDLTRPYDDPGENLDNILITLTIEHA